MEWGHWIIHPVTLWLHNTELLFTCISSKTEFTHFDHAHISLHVCVMLCHHHHRISSQPLFQCLCFIFAWFSSRSSALVTLLALSFPSVLCHGPLSLSLHLPLFEGYSLLMQCCHCSRSDKQLLDENMGFENWCVGYLHLITWLLLCIRHIKVWKSYSLQHIKNISHKAGDVASTVFHVELQQLTLLI